MRITLIDKFEWECRSENPSELLAHIEDGDVFIVRGFMTVEAVDQFKGFCLNFRGNEPASWHPCLDDCPDYHRIHHNYPNAYVPSIQHGYYFHPWNENFSRLSAYGDFRRIFDLKRRMAGQENMDYLRNIPSTGPVARIVSHQYPRGGGGQAEHIDPVSPFAKVQTLIQASQPGMDYAAGGLYVNDQKFGVVNIDALTKKGDLILLSPGVQHGVAPVDPECDLDWEREDGRWIIMPIIIHSDHIQDPNVRPVKTGEL